MYICIWNIEHLTFHMIAHNCIIHTDAFSWQLWFYNPLIRFSMKFNVLVSSKLNHPKESKMIECFDDGEVLDWSNV